MSNQIKKIFLGLIFFGSLTLSYLTPTQARAFEIVSYPSEIAHLIPEVNRIANQILTESARQVDDPDGIIPELMDLKLHAKKANSCAPNIQMRIHLGFTDDIYICPETIKDMQQYSGTKNLSIFTQMFLHEAIHRIGIHDECDTTKVELILMRNSSYERYLDYNGYASSCGLKP